MEKIFYRFVSVYLYTTPVFFSALLLLIITGLALPGTSLAGFEEEVDHLLNFIEASKCTFYRNDKQHDSAEARRHIERKYKHVKSRIKKTEQFIEYAATKSSISGKPYTVHCGKKVLRSSDWLSEELGKFRAR